MHVYYEAFGESRKQFEDGEDRLPNHLPDQVGTTWAPELTRILAPARR
jgi:hypothetical protein